MKTPTNHTQFPIFLVGKTKRRRRKGRALIPHFEGKEFADGRSMIQGVRKEHQAMIERLQPYKRRNSGLAGYGQNNVLYLLRELNDVDKHRLLQIVGVKPIAVSWGYWEGEQLSTTGTFDVTGSRLKVLKDGAKILEAPVGMHVNPNIIPLIAFSKGCDAVQNKAVLITLSKIAMQVQIIMELFEPAFPPNWEP